MEDALGADHGVWGTDAVWTGSPQWQIEALRRLEIPEDMRRVLAKEAEAERLRRAKVIAAKGEFQAATELAEAADKINLSLVLPHQVRLPATTASPFLRILAGFLTESCTRLNRLFSLPRMLCK